MIIREEEGRGGVNMLMVGVHFDAECMECCGEACNHSPTLSRSLYLCISHSPCLSSPIPGTPLFPIGIPISVYELHLFSKKVGRVASKVLTCCFLVNYNIPPRVSKKTPKLMFNLHCAAQRKALLLLLLWQLAAAGAEAFPVIVEICID